jgi:hypothetical protein
VDVGVPAQHGGWMHAVGPRNGLHPGNRGRAPTPLRGDDAGPGSASSHGAAAFLYPWPAQPRGPPYLCAADSFHPERHDEALSEPELAAGKDRGRRRAARDARTGRCACQDAHHVGLAAGGVGPIGLCAVAVQLMKNCVFPVQSDGISCGSSSIPQPPFWPLRSTWR